VNNVLKVVQSKDTTSAQQKQSPRTMIVGSKSTVGKIVASEASVAFNKSWHVFVGKLGKDVDEERLKDHLQDNGITVTEIRKLKATQPWQEKSSAFRVSVALACQDDIMNPDVWPENVKVRDWFFKPKN